MKSISETEHTPGPWTYGSPRREGEWFGTVVYASGQLSSPTAKALGLTSDESEANARLIVAAPELLEALRQLVRAIHEPDTMSGVLLDQAEAAIAKATKPGKKQ